MAASIASVVGLTLLIAALCWRFEQRWLGVLPMALCGVGLALYVLGFVNALSAIDWVLILLGLAALVWMALRTRREGVSALRAELRRQFFDFRLWLCLLTVAAVVFLMRDMLILEWDGYNFWGPSTKAIYFRDGYAAPYSNPASGYGTYTPMGQLLWAWGSHLTGRYSESAIFQVYYTFGTVLLFSVADLLPRRKNLLWETFICLAALLLPGVADTAWYRALCVDPWMSFLFGAALAETVHRDERHPGFWKTRIALYLLTLTLVKSIGAMWAALALLFFVLWHKKDRPLRFSLLTGAGVAAAALSWIVFCRLCGRSTYLSSSFTVHAAQRVREVLNGTFFSAGNNWGYITSYGRAFLFEPLHRELTPALDISTAPFLVLLFLFALLLRKTGHVDRRGYRLLNVFLGATLLLIYAVVGVGQMTMFYDETQYLEPLRAVTLLSRYASPAHVGGMMLLFSLCGRQEEEKARAGNRALAAAALAGCFILSSAAYTEIWRRFVNDSLNPRRMETRETLEGDFAGFLHALAAVPYREACSTVTLAVFGEDVNPVIVNAASPAAFNTVYLSGDASQDLSAIAAGAESRRSHALFVKSCSDETLAALNAVTAGGRFERGRLYRLLTDGAGGFTLAPAE